MRPVYLCSLCAAVTTVMVRITDGDARSWDASPLPAASRQAPPVAAEPCGMARKEDVGRA